MRRLIFIILFIIPAGVFSHNPSKWKQTPDGILYKIYTNDSLKPKPVYGDHLWMHLRKFAPNKKEVFNTKIFDTGKGVEMEYKTPGKKGDVTEIFSFMGKGDSAEVKIPSHLLDSNGRTNKFYTFKLNLVDFRSKALYHLEKQEHYKLQLVLDSLTMRDYMQNNNILDATEDAYGNLFLIRHHGSGRQITVSDSVQMHYRGKLANGKEFDNSYDRKQALPFAVDKKQVIEGLDKGIQNFHFGDSGIILIPSRLAYGDKEVGKIPPNSVLIFEIEILEK